MSEIPKILLLTAIGCFIFSAIIYALTYIFSPFQDAVNQIYNFSLGFSFSGLTILILSAVAFWIESNNKNNSGEY